MNDFRNIPKDTYSREAAWQELYVLSKQWKSDLMFYTDDIRFLHHLIDKYFLWISKKEHIDKVQEMELNLLKVDKECALLLERTKQHLQHLSQISDETFRNDSHQFRAEHETLEVDLAQFVKDFRKNRKEVFKIKEYIIEGEELVRQLHNIPQ